MSTFNITLRDNGSATFDIALDSASGTVLVSQLRAITAGIKMRLFGRVN